MNRIMLEVCSFSYEGCLNAEKGGANRIELCANPSEGGTTPSYGLIKKVRENIHLFLFPLIRPRGGDFFYSSDEFEIMLNDIKLCKDLGCDGIATGVQNSDGTIDMVKMKQIVETAWPMEVTCIRAFDIVPDAYEALDGIMNAGCKRVLTSGLAATAMEAAGFIAKLVQYAGDRIIIMPGSGVRADNIVSLMEITGAKEFHTSARFFVPNRAVWHSKFITDKDFGLGVSCDVNQVQKIRVLMDRFS